MTAAKRTPQSPFDWPKFTNNDDGRRAAAADRKGENLASSVHRHGVIFDEGVDQASRPTVEGRLLCINMDTVMSDVRINSR